MMMDLYRVSVPDYDSENSICLFPTISSFISMESFKVNDHDSKQPVSNRTGGSTTVSTHIVHRENPLSPKA